MSAVEIDAKGMHYTPLNKLIRKAVADGAKEIVLLMSEVLVLLC